jgi:hypothetical protein
LASACSISDLPSLIARSLQSERSCSARGTIAPCASTVEPQGRVGGYASFAVDDLVDPSWRDTDRHSEPVLGDLEWL